MKSLINSGLVSTHLKSYTGNVGDIAHLHKLFTSQYLRYDGSLFLP